MPTTTVRARRSAETVKAELRHALSNSQKRRLRKELAKLAHPTTVPASSPAKVSPRMKPRRKALCNIVASNFIGADPPLHGSQDPNFERRSESRNPLTDHA